MLENVVVTCLAPLLAWYVISGLDDVFLCIVYFFFRPEGPERPSQSQLEGAGEQRIAILVPLWREDRVIGQMLERNLAAIRYRNYHFFVGVYPNDEPTIAAVEAVAARSSRVHVAMCPHGGPTSKGDCLNSAYRRMQEYEFEHGLRFAVAAIHDAEDLIHADALRLMNWYSRRYDMVQTPILPLRTSPLELTHGIYCDEFAEHQLKDLPVRQSLGGFLPSNGVGTAFSRAALERLANERSGRVFDPESLTEDYEIGYCLHAMNFRQVFVPVEMDAVGPVATREYFPRRFRAAVRQRGRWVAGIALQGWERHGWGSDWRQRYWLWRDRKGLVGNWLSMVGNVMMLYGATTMAWAWAADRPWPLAAEIPDWAAWLSFLTLMLSVAELAVRAAAARRVYGWKYAAATPLRAFWANFVNCAATAEALHQFFGARLRRRNPAWKKTDHTYPSPAAAEY
jgi:adsorption protein B